MATGTISRSMLPAGWNTCSDSEAIEAYRYLRDEEILQIAYVSGRKVYDFPCPPDYFKAFLRAGSAGRFVQRTLKPYAAARGWSRPAYAWPW
jgi:hypothetical protein